MKNSLVFDSTSAVRLMQWSESTDCCTWSGIECDVAGLVIGLDLSIESITGEIENVTGLFGLQHLESLNLAFNNFNATPIPSRLANLTNLVYLNLSYAGFAGQLPSSISGMTKLVTLDLSSLTFVGDSLLQLENPNLKSAGPIDLSLGNLQSLSVIRLNQNNLSSPVPGILANFSNLTSLHLSNCELQGTFPEKILQVPTLETLELSHNSLLEGSLPDFPRNNSLRSLMLQETSLSGPLPYSIGELKRKIPSSLFSRPLLKQLQLANNQFEGQLPEFLNPSTSVLKTLDLTGNRLEGHIPMSIFELKHLSILLLSSNKFNGTVQLDQVQKLSNLTRLDFSYNSLVVNASSVSSFPPKISTLKLASCNLSMIPDLKNQTNLYQLDLSDNQISGEIPNWIWGVGNGNLIHLNLSHNLLVGLQEPYNLSNLSVLDLHFNQLQGEIPYPPQCAIYVDYSCNFFTSIPVDIGTFLPFTMFFSVSNNSLTGVIPKTICNSAYLQVLDLSDNNLNGMIPTCLIQKIETLGVLNLRRNNLTGTIPDAFPENCGLQTLNLNGNQLEGRVPKSLANCTTLEVLDLGNNQITDNFPCWLKYISSFRVLVLRSNKFYGTIGCPEIKGNWSMLQIVDLASNNFCGKLPAIGFAVGFGAVVAPLMFSKKVNKWYDDFISKYKVKFIRVFAIKGIKREKEPRSLAPWVVHVVGQQGVGWGKKSSTWFPMRSLFLSWLSVGIWFLVSVKEISNSLLLKMKGNLVFSSTSLVRLVRWSQSTDCSTWSGVDYDAAGRVIGLDLSN
ncbi:hypothetical protein Pint_34898 [Pistacia integerrima]|uniref:Uncharacterized protein n=1 Tax=Pistacia integerrima TaxID=434235 RepID=A0ACC0Y124_9ROSI|nr:hypothetical protein Pint_34898 [Pistacia integerrima]